jgi:hypothetical protein
LPTKHLRYLPCWSDAIQRMKIFKNADLILYSSVQPSANVLEQLPFQNTYVKLYKNGGYQEGAVQAMMEPFGENVTWFDNYDWVIRLNPDVLIRNDTWLIQTMLDPSIDGIFHDCFGAKIYPLHKIHTDFVAFRPKAVNRTMVLEAGLNISTAEAHLTQGFGNILDSRRFTVVDGAVNPINGTCRIEGPNSPIVHSHDLWRRCPHYYDASDLKNNFY